MVTKSTRTVIEKFSNEAEAITTMLIFATCQAEKTTMLASASKNQTNDRGDRQYRKRRGLILTLYNRKRLNGVLIEQLGKMLHSSLATALLPFILRRAVVGGVAQLLLLHTTRLNLPFPLKHGRRNFKDTNP